MRRLGGEIQHDFANMRAFVHFRVCGGDVPPGIAAVQMRFYDAVVGEHWPEFCAQAGGNRRFLVAAATAQGRAGDVRAFDRDFQQIDFGRDVAAHEADEEDAAVFVETVEVLREVAAADEVEDAVRAAVGFGDGGEVVAFVVNSGRAVVLVETHFLGGANGGEGGGV